MHNAAVAHILVLTPSPRLSPCLWFSPGQPLSKHKAHFLFFEAISRWKSLFFSSLFPERFLWKAQLFSLHTVDVLTLLCGNLFGFESLREANRDLAPRDLRFVNSAFLKGTWDWVCFVVQHLSSQNYIWDVCILPITTPYFLWYTKVTFKVQFDNLNGWKRTMVWILTH